VSADTAAGPDQRAFLGSFMGESAVTGTDEQFARVVVQTLLAGIAPGAGPASA
jgi:hypothetical protein